MLLGGKKIEVLPAAHTVPAVGFGVDGGAAGWWVFTGDTGPNPALWERLAAMNVAHLVIETAFGDDERQLARISRHLCPSALGHELKNLGGSVDVHITHIKPGEMDAVMAEIGRLGSPHRISALAAGQTMSLTTAKRREPPADRFRVAEPAVVTRRVSFGAIRAGAAAIGDRLCQLGRLQFTNTGKSAVARPLQ